MKKTLVYSQTLHTAGHRKLLLGLLKKVWTRTYGIICTENFTDHYFNPNINSGDHAEEKDPIKFIYHP